MEKQNKKPINWVALIYALVFVGVVLHSARLISRRQVTLKVVELGTILKEKDISRLDNYFSPDTRFVWGSNTATYKELRGNFIKGFKDNVIDFSTGPIYVDRHTKVGFLSVEASCMGWPSKHLGKHQELNFDATFVRKSLFAWDIVELKEDGRGYGYVLFNYLLTGKLDLEDN